MADKTEAMEHVIHSSMPIDFERRYAMDNLIAQDADLIDINNKDGAVLLRCPFCDGEAKITTCDLLDGDQWACVCCKVCNAQIVNEDEEDAITAWNTRQPTQSDALKAAGDAIRGLLDIASDDNLDSEQAGRAYAALHDIGTALKGQSK